ncbi:mitochondrial fission ELM1 family protein [bacterium]|nr:mitochondrial fission ELM1 family protein [bacterium]
MPVRVVIASDGKKGHLNQSLVAARMLGDENPMVVTLRKDFNELPLRLRFASLGRGAITRAGARGLVERKMFDELPIGLTTLGNGKLPQDKDLRIFTVSTGTSVATANLVLARMLQADPIVCMTPSLLPRKLFRLNLVPPHDVKDREHLPENIIVTPAALSHHDEIASFDMANQLARDNNLNPDFEYIAMAIGGPSNSAPWREETVIEGLREVLKTAEVHEQKLLVSTSRRTPDWCRNWLIANYVGNPAVSYFLDANNSELNPLPGFFVLADGVVVTCDSFSMVGEAVNSGHRPIVIKVNEPPQSVKEAEFKVEKLDKMNRAVMNLSNEGLVDIANDAFEIRGCIIRRSRRKKPNLLYERVMDEVRQRLNIPEEVRV